ncbi:MAG: hypothetical protein CMD92_07230 [Gammaproteobacteria bacterium]|nr:hypothetical protein [Gammaproteobacteria bacterium]
MSPSTSPLKPHDQFTSNALKNLSSTLLLAQVLVKFSQQMDLRCEIVNALDQNIFLKTRWLRAGNFVTGKATVSATVVARCQ